MQFDERTLLRKCNLSRNDVERLRRRQRGGTSGQKGYEYQRRYALLRVAELAFTSPMAIVTMEALCPVDDVVIQDGDAHEHAQCKMSERETWSKKLEQEFAKQIQIFNNLGVADYRLVLVVADSNQRDRLEAKLPSKLTGKTEVACFPQPSPEHHPWRVPRTVAALDQLLPPLLRTPSSREQLYKELNHAAGTPWQSQQSVKNVLDSLAQQSPDLPLAMPPGLARAWAVPLDEWTQALALMARIPGLAITTDGGVCCYTCGNESGRIARCDTPLFRRFVQDVIAHRPKTMEDFLKVRP